MNKGQLLYYSCKEIGIPRMADYACYLIQKKSGQIKKTTPLNGFQADFEIDKIELTSPISMRLPEVKSLLEQDRKKILASAEEILSGVYHPFGGESQPLIFEDWSSPAQHWSMNGDRVNGVDIKWLWEPARFSWAFDLVRAWIHKEDDRYVRFFWDRFHEFNQHNPVNSAPNWTSAQEVGLRLLTWLMVYQVFRKSPATTEMDRQALIEAVWQHAARIPSTLGYARSQNNNHLLSESLALIAAGQIFSNVSRRARNWQKLGLRQFNRGILDQIETNGTYSQHSANYHRMMLQLGLLYFGYAQMTHMEIPKQVMQRLAAATRWMNAQLDTASGRLPNLGHNDGSLPLPMGCREFRDYRPTVQAASLAFLGEACLLPGPWDELSLWLGLDPNQKPINSTDCPAVHQLVKGDTRAILRGVQFHGRPAHADQLHVDLWWDGINIAQDAGTFCYNCELPWQNPFTSTLVHNTISVDDEDQMLKAGKFLWLKQAQAHWLHENDDEISASHGGYKRIGLDHERTLRLENTEQVLVSDLLTFAHNDDERNIRLHWLLPDWQWKLEGQCLILHKDEYFVELSINAVSAKDSSARLANDISLIRAGETLAGERRNPVMGWVSDTYGEKHPALSFSCLFRSNGTLQIDSNFKLCKSTSRTGK